MLGQFQCIECIIYEAIKRELYPVRWPGSSIVKIERIVQTLYLTEVWLTQISADKITWDLPNPDNMMLKR